MRIITHPLFFDQLSKCQENIGKDLPGMLGKVSQLKEHYFVKGFESYFTCYRFKISVYRIFYTTIGNDLLLLSIAHRHKAYNEENFRQLEQRFLDMVKP